MFLTLSDSILGHFHGYTTTTKEMTTTRFVVLQYCELVSNSLHQLQHWKTVLQFKKGLAFQIAVAFSSRFSENDKSDAISR